MAIDNDLSALLPDPPPPRPARREAAIDEALRRFDGGPPQAPAPPRPARVRTGWGRPQIAALASVALVVLVSVPVWWAERERIVPHVPPPVAQTATAVGSEPAPAAPPSPAAAIPAPAEPTASASPAAPVPAPVAESAAQAAPSAPAASADALSAAGASLSRPPAAPPGAAPAPPPAARRAEADAAIVVSGSRIQRQGYDSTTPVVTADEALLQNGSGGGDWNSCTLADPGRDIAACRAFADPSARGAKGRAGAQLADGLTLAWQGDLDRAIAAFDRAVEADPDLAIAYLNRGLARQAQGDLRRALADLDRAVAADPRSAAAYHHRSLLQRARGNDSRADADARRAAALGQR